MIVLVQPMYSKQELNGDSSYISCTQLIRGMLVARPDWHFFFIFPDDKSGYKYDADGFFKLPNVTRIPQRTSPRKMANAASFDAMWFDTLFRHLAFDVVWCNLIESAGPIKFAGQSAYEPIARPAVVGAHHYVIHKTLPYRYESLEHIALAQITGAINCDLHVFNSDYCQWMFFDNAARYLNTATLEKLKAAARRVDYGVLDGSLQTIKRNNRVPIIVYNHRLQAYKNYVQTFELLDKLHRQGLKFEVWFTNSAAEHTAHVSKYPFVSLKLCATRAEYVKTLQQCDLNVTNSQHETFCIAAAESMAVGQPLVAPMGVTFPEITNSAENGYPYLFRNEAEQKAMLTKLLTDAAEREKWGAILSQQARKRYSNRLWAENYAALFESIDVGKTNTKDHARALAIKEIKACNGATMKEALLRIYMAGEALPKKPFSTQSLTPVKFMRLARELGARITVEDGQERVRS